jgi:hypothetical protein
MGEWSLWFGVWSMELEEREEISGQGACHYT